MRSTLLVLALLAGCQNAFVHNYSGRVYQPIGDARIVSGEPAEAEYIGSSSFTASVQYGDGDVLSAANEIGAHFVRWSSSSAGTTMQPTLVTSSSVPTVERTNFSGVINDRSSYAGTSYYGTATTYGTQTVTTEYLAPTHWLHYSAQFYRRR